MSQEFKWGRKFANTANSGNVKRLNLSFCKKKNDHIMCIALLYQPYVLNKGQIVDIC